jgi:5-histidylcysteine sulfoxide synthase/putative 4-mercaptohistidine N1-methyltranferase
MNAASYNRRRNGGRRRRLPARVRHSRQEAIMPNTSSAETQNLPHQEPWRRNLRGNLDGELRGPRPDWWWTGLPPRRCPGVQADGTLTSLPLPDLAACTRQQVLDYFDNGWTLTELLFSALQGEEAFYRPPYHHLRHPMVFYYCHPPALYINKLRVARLREAPLDAYYERLFETGVDEMRWDDMSKNEMLWPALRDAHAYRRQVYAIVRALIESHPGLAPGHEPITQADPLWALFMGFEHERIHLETSSVLMRELPLALLRRPPEWPPLHPSALSPQPDGGDVADGGLIEVPARQVDIGKPFGWPAYGWDNEYGRRAAQVQPFHAGRRLVSNARFHAFVLAGGYRERRWWSETGWSWRSFRNVKWPSFWVPHGPAGLHRYRLRTLFEEVPLPMNWPAEVNWHEAKAYCAWLSAREGRSFRLPTEAEHQALRGAQQRDEAQGIARDPVMRRNGRAFRELGWNANLAWGSPGPVDAGAATAQGFQDVFGNVWQWLEDHFHPLPGARVHPYYDDFSTPCYDGEHQMMLGGSWVSTGDEASIWARFHFRPHFFQHAGFRLVAAAHDGAVVRLDRAGLASPYEERRVVDEYMLLHYGAPGDQMPHGGGPVGALDFPARCARWLTEGARAHGVPTRTALDIGCAVGRASFELARVYDEVLGVDLSAAFIEAAQALQRDGERQFFRVDEGELGSAVTGRVDPAIDRGRVGFRRAGACSLPAEFADFDAVLIANVLCRLPSPKALLGRLGGPRGLVAVGGLLALFSPYSWLARYTPPEAWLGGREIDGRPVRSAEALRALLQQEGFELLREADEPLVIREHARKYQYIVTHAMLWRRVR